MPVERLVTLTQSPHPTVFKFHGTERFRHTFVCRRRPSWPSRPSTSRDLITWLAHSVRANQGAKSARVCGNIYIYIYIYSSSCGNIYWLTHSASVSCRLHHYWERGFDTLSLCELIIAFMMRIEKNYCLGSTRGPTALYTAGLRHPLTAFPQEN